MRLAFRVVISPDQWHPTVTVPNETVTPKLPEKLSDSPTTRVLVVDDELSARNVLAAILAQDAFACKTAATGKAALDILEKELVDAVISDLRMPGISGLELLTEVRRKYPDLAFLVVTGVDDIRVGIDAMQRGADDYLGKPFDVVVVITSLNRALQRRRLEQEVENYRRHLEEMVAERTQQLEDALKRIARSYEDTLEVLGAAIDLRDSLRQGAHGVWFCTRWNLRNRRVL